MLENIGTIMEMVLIWENIWLLFLGVFLGITIGSVPGLTGTMAIALVVPFTFGMESMPAISLLIGLYCGSTFGGAIAGILVNIPGTAAAIMTTYDGYPMAQKGEAGRAIGIATISSVCGGIISGIILLVAAPQIARIAIDFGSPEYFALAVFGLTVIARLSDDSLIKGIMAAVIGILISLIGIDGLTGQHRFTFGMSDLNGGIDFIPLMIGLYGVSTLLLQFSKIKQNDYIIQKISRIIPTKKDIKRVFSTMIKGSGIGTLVGALPGAGATVSAILAYGEAKRSSKTPEKFGDGTPEGIAAPESANNAVTGGALIPMLTLGIPGDGVTAILIGAFMLHNLTPGPLLIPENPSLIGFLFVSLMLAYVFLLIIGLLGSKYFARIINIPPNYLFPVLFVFCFIGAYAVNFNMFDVAVVLVFGLLGFLLEKIGLPIGPVVLGFILGPIAEIHLRQSLMLSQMDISTLIASPISIFIWILIFLSLFSKHLLQLVKLITVKRK